MPVEHLDGVPGRAGRKEWIGLGVLALACVLYAMDLTVLHLAVPSLTRELRPSSTQLLWITDIYGFLVAGSLMTMGTLGDRIGRRRLLLTGATAFGAASLLAAFSPSASTLIVARALLGVAGATLAPSTLSLIRHMFEDPDQRRVAIGVWITSFSVGGAIGPLLGGVMLEFFWWGSVFLLNVPVMILLLVVGPRLLPEFRDPEAGRLDILGAVLSLATVLAIIYGLKQIAQDGIGLPAVLVIVGGLGLGGAFVHRQRTQADPLVDLRLFRAPAFSVSLVTFTLAVFAMIGSFLFIAQYMQLVLGLSPLEAGLWMLPEAFGFIVGSMVAPALSRRVPAPHVMGGGLALAGAGLVLLTQVGPADGLAVLVTASAVLALGLAPVFTLGTDLVVGTAPPERAGAASGISETSFELGGALEIAVLGSIGTALYRSRLAERLTDDIPGALAEAAKDTLGGALAVAQGLPSEAAGELVTAAHVAFTDGFRVTAAIGAVLMLGTAAVATALLRDVGRTGAADEGQPGPSAGVAATPAVAVEAGCDE